MAGKRRLAWLPRICYHLCLGVAALIAATVLLAPFVDRGGPAPRGVHRIVALVARDVALRRTALASAIGLGVTAGVFFRPQMRAYGAKRAAASSESPGKMMGA
jgi:hypothetical protein